MLGHSTSATDSDIGSDIDTSDLPPPAPRRQSSPRQPGESEPGESSSGGAGGSSSSNGRGRTNTDGGHTMTAAGAIRQLFTSEDPTALFRQLDEDFIKPTLLLDGGNRNGNGGPS